MTLYFNHNFLTSFYLINTVDYYSLDLYVLIEKKNNLVKESLLILMTLVYKKEKQFLFIIVVIVVVGKHFFSFSFCKHNRNYILNVSVGCFSEMKPRKLHV